MVALGDWCKVLAGVRWSRKKRDEVVQQPVEENKANIPSGVGEECDLWIGWTLAAPIVKSSTDVMTQTEGRMSNVRKWVPKTEAECRIGELAPSTITVSVGSRLR